MKSPAGIGLEWVAGTLLLVVMAVKTSKLNWSAHCVRERVDWPHKPIPYNFSVSGYMDLYIWRISLYGWSIYGS